MIGGLHLLQAAIIHLKQSSLEVNMEKFISLNLGYSLGKTDSIIRVIHETKQHNVLASVFFPQATIKYFDVLYIRNMRISTTQYARNKKSDDSHIIFRHNNLQIFGSVCSIFCIENQRYVLKVSKKNIAGKIFSLSEVEEAL